MNVGDFVKIYCQGGLIETGQISEYEEDRITLDMIDGTKFIVFNPQQNVIAVRVSNTKDVSRKKSDVSVDIELEPDPNVTDTDYNSHDLRFKTKAELHKMAAHEERKRARELLTSFEPEESIEVQFETPDFSKPVFEHTPKEIRRRIRRHRKNTLKKRDSE